MIAMIPRTLTKKEIAIALGLSYEKNGLLVIRYKQLRRDFFTDEFIKDTLEMDLEKYNSTKQFNIFTTRLIVEHFNITEEDF